MLFISVKTFAGGKVFWPRHRASQAQERLVGGTSRSLQFRADDPAARDTRPAGSLIEPRSEIFWKSHCQCIAHSTEV